MRTITYNEIGFILLALALPAMACNFSLNLPVTEIKSGPPVTEEIDIPMPPGDGPVDISLAFAAGLLKIKPGEPSSLVKGTATYTVPELKPVIETNGTKVSIGTGDLQIKGIPKFSGDVKNEWDLNFGERPMNLAIDAGAYQGQVDLGGLAINNLTIKDGASDVNLNFSQPNLVEMDTLNYQTGASKAELSQLGNANFRNMLFRVGAGTYTLDFSGQFTRDANVDMEGGFSNIEIVVPNNMNVRVTLTGGLNNITTSGNWTKVNNQYTQEGEGPLLQIAVNLGAGNLKLSSS